jgi:nicotinate phosphoribosyltransferase
MPSTALLTDHYELTMLDAALADGTATRPCVFETFARRLPAGRRFGVVAGLGRLVEAIERFRFDDAVLGYLDDHQVVSGTTVDWLADYRFTGELHAYREGELYYPHSPVVSVRGTFAEAVVLETLVLSVLNFDSAIASAAARMVWAADGRPLLEFGSRRTHEEAAVAAARAAYVAGFAATSNLEAGRRYGIPTTGTSAHAFTLVHDDEDAAFRSQVATQGAGTTLLVDTYDTFDGLDRAVAAAGTGLGGVRIDSGDLAADARRARTMLDARGATGTRIVLSGDLDEFELLRLRETPADSYGVGTRLVTGSGAPTASMVYKLVARATSPHGALEPVAKSGGAKATVGARKAAWRRIVEGTAVTEVLHPWDEPPPAGEGRAVHVAVLRDGEIEHGPSLDEIRAHHAAAVAELPASAFELSPGDPVIPTRHESADHLTPHTDLR